MEKLLLNAETLNLILNDSDAFCELRDFLNSVIDEELNSKNIDCDLIDECVIALEELSLENNESKPHLTALLSEEKFIRKIQHSSILRKKYYKGFGAVAAAAVLLIAAGQIPAGSGQTVARAIGNKIASVLHIEQFGERDEGPAESHTVLKLPEPENDVPPGEPTTEEPYVTETQKSPETPKAVTLTGLEATFEKGFKTEYKLGDTLNTDGMLLTANYSDGSKKQIAVGDCSIYVPAGFYRDAGVYKITLTYNEKTVSYNVSVYAEKESVILNSIYGTFPEGFSFTVADFDDVRLDGMTVTGVYSDGSEKEIPLENCEITVEKGFMELPNKALVTVMYEERSFSFILTEEVRENEKV